ncbi:MAG: DUF2799 domain-containing protein [Pseudomonadota bacterium]
MIRAAVIAAVALSGCVAITPEQCEITNWYERGREDGLEGRGEARFAEYAETCAKAGVTPDRAAWSGGRAEGLLGYCAPAGAWNAGKDGKAIIGICPAPSEAAIAAHERGSVWRSIDLEIRDLRREIRDLKSEIRSEVKQGRKRKGYGLGDRTSLPNYGYVLLLEGRIDALEHEIDHLRDERAAYAF